MYCVYLRRIFYLTDLGSTIFGVLVFNNYLANFNWIYKGILYIYCNIYFLLLRSICTFICSADLQEDLFSYLNLVLLYCGRNKYFGCNLPALRASLKEDLGESALSASNPLRECATDLFLQIGFEVFGAFVESNISSFIFAIN